MSGVQNPKMVGLRHSEMKISEAFKWKMPSSIDLSKKQIINLNIENEDKLHNSNGSSNIKDEEN